MAARVLAGPLLLASKNHSQLQADTNVIADSDEDKSSLYSGPCTKGQRPLDQPRTTCYLADLRTILLQQFSFSVFGATNSRPSRSIESNDTMFLTNENEAGGQQSKGRVGSG